MKRFRVTALALSPVVIPVEGFITGPSFRGALAYQYLRSNGFPDPNKDELFQRAFVKERLLAAPLYPGHSVLPLTSLSCKRNPGFRRGDSSGPHGVIDLLWSKIADAPRPNSCPVCGQDLKGLHGFYSENTQQKPFTVLETHVGIDRVSRTSADGVLYTLHTLEPGEKLYGVVYVLDDDLEPLLAERVYCGAEKTRGRGLLRLTWEEEQIPTEEERQNAWLSWNEELRIRISDNKEDFYFTLTLDSETIIVDRFLRPSTDPADAVSWLPKCHPGAQKSFGRGTLRFITGASQSQLIKGWNSAHGLPKEQDIATGRGSVFCYSFQGDDTDLAALIHELYILELEGMGLRRGEGFGRLSISSPFHAAFSEVR